MICRQINLTATDRKEFISTHQRLNSSPINQSQQKPFAPQNPSSVNAGPCVNIDFEGGNLNGWIPTSGFHPIFNPLGCCPTPGGQQTIMTGAGVDPAGGFPVVATGGTGAYTYTGRLVLEQLPLPVDWQQVFTR